MQVLNPVCFRECNRNAIIIIKRNNDGDGPATGAAESNTGMEPTINRHDFYPTRLQVPLNLIPDVESSLTPLPASSERMLRTCSS